MMMKRITAMFTLLLMPLALSISPMTMVHAATISGTGLSTSVTIGTINEKNGNTIYLTKGPFRLYLLDYLEH
jgi:hypothetical protein